MTDQQLVARIKRSSKYWGQTAPNAWFDVRAVGDRHYQLRGNSNNYQLRDVIFGVRIRDGTILDLSNGKTIGKPMYDGPALSPNGEGAFVPTGMKRVSVAS